MIDLNFEQNVQEELPQLAKWLQKASGLNTKTAMRLAITIYLELSRWPSWEVVVLTPALLSRHGITSNSAYRGWKALEAAGLLHVRSNHGESPRVAIRMDGLEA